MNSRIATLAAMALLGGSALQADNLTFELPSNPGQNYTFTPVGSTKQVTEYVGPYSAYIDQNGVTTWGEYFCISFTKTSYENTAYTGKVVDPSTQQEVEAAYLDSELVNDGGVNAPLADKGAISMAIWQIMDPGQVPLDPAAQPYVTGAETEFSDGKINASMFTDSKIFIPNDNCAQSFMLLAGETHPCATPEPGPALLVLSGAVLFGIARRKRA
jgi:hypothetical protein